MTIRSKYAQIDLIWDLNHAHPVRLEPGHRQSDFSPDSPIKKQARAIPDFYEVENLECLLQSVQECLIFLSRANGHTQTICQRRHCGHVLD